MSGVHAACPLCKDVNHTLLDGQLRSCPGRLDAERHHERASGATMGDRNRVGFQRIIPPAHADRHRGVAFSARRRHVPLVVFACRKYFGMRDLHLGTVSSPPIDRIQSREAGRRLNNRRAANQACRATAPWSGALGQGGSQQTATRLLRADPGQVDRPEYCRPAQPAFAQNRSRGYPGRPEIGRRHSTPFRRDGCSK